MKWAMGDEGLSQWLEVYASDASTKIIIKCTYLYIYIRRANESSDRRENMHVCIELYITTISMYGLYMYI